MWDDIETVRRILNEDPVTCDPDLLSNSSHRVRNWKETFKEEKMPKHPRLHAKFSEIMDKHQSMFSHSPGEWRFLNIEPLELRFTNNDTPVVAKAVPMNDLKDRIITDKIMRLIDLDLITTIEPSIDEITNISNL